MNINEAPLPKGWAFATLESLAGADGIFVDGDWVESKDQDPEGEVRLIQLADIGDGIFRNRSDRFLTSTKAHQLRCTFLQKNDLLIARMPEPLGRSCLFPIAQERRNVTVVDVCVLRIGCIDIDPKYIMFAINSSATRNKISSFQSGSTRKRISRGNLARIEIPIPPAPEQLRIVAKIEALFSEIDKGIESLTTAREQLKAYRQSILKAAFEGKLTADWRIENDVPEVWESIELGKCGRWQGGGTPSKAVSSYWDAGQILWVSPKDMKQRMIQNTQQKITKLGSDNSPAKLIEQKSLLFVIRSGILRRALPIAIAPPNITINQDMNSLVPSKHMVEFLYWYCHANERVIREQCSKDGTTVESIDIARLKRVKVPIPSLTEQEQIVKKISATLGSLELVEDLLSTEMMKAANLRQSILKRAFSGQLVPQDPNDEPASVLLDRIRAAHTKAHTQKTHQSKKAGKVTE